MNCDSDFPNDSTEERGHFVSISESVGHYMTFKILTDKSSKTIHSSNVRPADIPLDKSIHLDPLTIPHVVTSKRELSNKNALNTTENDESFDNSTNAPILDTLDLVGRIFLIPADKDRQRLREKIVRLYMAMKKNV